SYPLYGYYSYLIKMDEKGIEQWAKLYGRNGDEYQSGYITQTLDGCYAFGGHASIQGQPRSFLVKMNSQGVKIFEKNYRDSVSIGSSDGNYSLLQAADGGFVFCSSSVNNFKMSECSLIKTDSSGNSGCLVDKGFGEFYSIKSIVSPLNMTVSSIGQVYIDNNEVDVFPGINPITYCTTGNPVWPGDTDDNSVADNYDLLPIGLYFNRKGAMRSSISNNWQPYSSTEWGTIQTNGHDIKHSDSNGDGIITADDTLAIHLNFGFKHMSPPSPNIDQDDRPDLYFITPNKTFNSGDIVNIEIWLGTTNIPVTDLYGLAFNVHYNTSIVQSGTESFVYSDNTLGIDGIDAIKIVKIDAPTNTVYCGETRIDHKNATVYGKLGELKFRIKNSLSPDTKIVFSISDYKANDAMGNPIKFNLKTDTITINPTLGIKELDKDLLITIAPNPFTSRTVMSFDKELKNATIKILNILGQEMKAIPFSGDKLVIEKGELKPGIYFIQVTLANVTIVNQKVMIQ
ncbi:MAG TPA: T9SS type A sorting domain-containing protein, partial [Bacteroidia bacterium]|nr:T9SS type A sorting domain-containing protein [Bacteroidia bacterium]